MSTLTARTERFRDPRLWLSALGAVLIPILLLPVVIQALRGRAWARTVLWMCLILAPLVVGAVLYSFAARPYG